jgi:hypothetical protein
MTWYGETFLKEKREHREKREKEELQEKKEEEEKRILRQEADRSVEDAAEEELKQYPPTKDEWITFFELKCKEADNYIEKDDPEYPTWEWVETKIGKPLTGLSATWFLENIRRKK